MLHSYVILRVEPFRFGVAGAEPVDRPLLCFRVAGAVGLDLYLAYLAEVVGRQFEVGCKTDGPGRDRTCDLGIKSPLLYQLSYRPAA